MSADNWAVCPKCKAKAEERHADLARQVSEGYGVLPVGEFDELRTELAAGINERALTTFREDYEIYGASEGTVTVSYGGHCDVCGASCRIEHSQVVS